MHARRRVICPDTLPQNHEELVARLGERGVQLESLLVRSPLIFCTVRVLNVSFQKHVHFRVTKDNWKTFIDVDASFMPGSSDGRSDRFYVSRSIADI